MHRPLSRAGLLVLAVAAAVAAPLLGPVSVSATTFVAGTTTVTPSLSEASLAAQARMATLLPARVAAAKALGTTKTGLVADLETGQALWSLSSATPMRGASTTKLATAVTALHLLGTGTRWPTRVVTGRTSTEVVLVGGGDPMLTSSQLRSLARTTATAVLARVAPAVVAVPAVPTIDGLPSPTVTQRLAPRAVRVSVRLDDSLYPTPTSATGWSSDYLPYVVRPVRPLVRDLRSGTDVAQDAAGYFAAQLSAELAALTAGRADVTASAAYTGRLTRPAGAVELARFAGNTSRAALARMLLVSDNDVAEMLFRDSAIAAGRSGSWYDARRTEGETLRSLGIPVTGWALYDGSGVSRSDRVTALGLVSLLTVARSTDHPDLSPLTSMLPVAAVSGTLRTRFTALPTSCAARKVFAKTGTLFDTVALAGYALGSDDRLRAFAVLVHDSSPLYGPNDIRRAVEVVPATATGCY